MRQLVLLRGAMGSGKSTWVKNNHLEDFTLSPDSVRVMYGALSKRNEQGLYSANAKKDGPVWEAILKMLEYRMSSGIFTVIDATHGTERAINIYRELSRKYRYRVYVVDFQVPLEDLIDRVNKRNTSNLSGADNKYIPTYAVVDKFQQLSLHSIPHWVTKLDPKDAIDKLKWQFEELGDRKLYVFGDIHSSYKVLKDAWDKLGLEDNYKDMIVFVGDLFDRGIRPVETFKFFQDKVTRPNVTLIMGNHDYNLANMVRDTVVNPPRHTYYNTYLPLKRAGVSEKEIKNFIDTMYQGVFLKGKQPIYITHGGIYPYNTKDPLGLNKLSTSEMIYGTGDFSYDLDGNFPDVNVMSIHGHRNLNHGKAIYKNGKSVSVNLEQGVDEGKNLAVAIVEDGLVTVKQFKNYEFNLSAKDMKWASQSKIKYLLANPNAYLEAAKRNSYINVKHLNKGIATVNFSESAFKGKVWDDFTVRSRGLFIDTYHNEVYARGYDKFFRVDELGGWGKLQLHGNLDVYKKYNGFLGMLTYDVHQEKLIYFSKGSIFGNDDIPVSPYAQLVKETVESEIRGHEDFLKSLLKDKTMLFEVVNEEKDPHIVHNFDKPKAVMLDIVYNDLIFRKMSYKSLTNISDKIGLPLKKHIATISNRNLRGSLQKLARNKELEGFVLEDESGYMFKAKTYIYSAVKARRNMWERIVKQIAYGEPLTVPVSEQLKRYQSLNFGTEIGESKEEENSIKKLDYFMGIEASYVNPVRNLLKLREKYDLLL